MSLVLSHLHTNFLMLLVIPQLCLKKSKIFSLDNQVDWLLLNQMPSLIDLPPHLQPVLIHCKYLEEELHDRLNMLGKLHMPLLTPHRFILRFPEDVCLLMLILIEDFHLVF